MNLRRSLSPGSFAQLLYCDRYKVVEIEVAITEVRDGETCRPLERIASSARARCIATTDGKPRQNTAKHFGFQEQKGPGQWPWFVVGTELFGPVVPVFAVQTLCFASVPFWSSGPRSFGLVEILKIPSAASCAVVGASIGGLCRNSYDFLESFGVG